MVRLTSLFGSWRGISRQARAKRRSRQTAWRPRGRWRILSLEMLEDRSLPSFIAPLNYDTGSSPSAVAVADFNHDGVPDIVTGSRSGTVSVLLGNGDGTFQPTRNSDAGITIEALALGDVNGDGLPDLVVVGADRVNVLLGVGDGTFRPGPSYYIGPTIPTSVALADLNGDGNLDIVVGSNNFPIAGETVHILLGNGDGTFRPGTAYDTLFGARSVLVADLNHDNRPDLVVVSFHTYVFLGNGDGTFQPPVEYSDIGGDVGTLADVNGDGKPDLITNQTVFLGNGDGTFQSGIDFQGDNTYSAVAVADVNGDNRLDLVAVASDGNAYVLLGNGDGTFGSPRSYAVGAFLTGVAVADLNGDRVPDLIAADENGDDVAVRLGNGDGSFPTAPTYDAGDAPTAVAVGDVNGDGIPDVVIANYTGTVSVLLGNGDGTFQPLQTFPITGGATAVTLADVNGDGILDIVTANTGRRGVGHTVSVLLGVGDGTFQPPRDFEACSGPTSVQAADLNGDSFPDLVVVNTSFPMPATTVSVLLNNGDGTFQPPQSYTVGVDPIALALWDFNGDGAPDVAVANNRSNTVSVLLNNGDGTFRPAPDLAVGNSPLTIGLADFNGDGIMDLVVGNDGSNTIGVLLSNGDGTFQTQRTSAADHPVSLATEDFTGDGIPDVVVTNGSGIRLLVGNGDGTFQPARTTYGGGGAYLAQGDFNSDGIPDVVEVDGSGRSRKATVFLNAGDGGGSPTPGGHTPGAARHVHHHDAFGGLATALSLPRAEEERAPSATAAVSAITTYPPPMGIMLARDVAAASEDGRLAESWQWVESPPVADGWLHLARLDLEVRDAVFAGTLS